MNETYFFGPTLIWKLTIFIITIFLEQIMFKPVKLRDMQFSLQCLLFYFLHFIFISLKPLEHYFPNKITFFCFKKQKFQNEEKKI